MLRKKFLKFVLMMPVLAGLCLCINALPADKAEEIKVDKTVHDFGTIKEDGGDVSAVFTIKNDTKTPIILSEVRASCGCTTPDWTKEPIAPKKSGKVTAIYSPKGRPGPFEKTVTINVSSGDKTKTIEVKIKGTVE